MTFPLARLVSGPDPMATVRYDFNDECATAPRRVTADFSLGVPALLTAPDAVSPAYGFRTISMGHVIRGSKADALAALAVLSRELLRSTSWFLFQLDAFSRPAWFKVYSTSPEAVSFDQVYVDTKNGDPTPLADFWSVRATFTADTFGYGERVAAPTATVGNNLATALHPMRFDLPTIKGDAPTDLRVRVTPAASALGDPGTIWETISTSGTTAAVEPAVVDMGAAGAWAITGPGSEQTSAAYLYGTYLLVQPTTTAVALDATVSLPHRGRYKVLVHASGDTGGLISAATVELWLPTLAVSTGVTDTSLATSKYVALQSADGRRAWVDLGEITVPLGNHLPVDVTGDLAPLPVRIVTRAAGGGTDSKLRYDALLFVPIDGDDMTVARTMSTTFARITLDDAHTGTWDGDDETIWLETHAGVICQTVPTPQGGFPVADPAAEANVLWVFPQSVPITENTGTTVTDVSVQWDVTVSYHPRLLHLDGRP